MHEVGGKRRVFIQEAGALIFARLRASVAGFKGEFVEAHKLDAKTAWKIPKKMQERTLTEREVGELLARME